MTSERWDDVFAIFDVALTRAGEERDAFLVRTCGDNARLREYVESLLSAHQDAEGFLSSNSVRATRRSDGFTPAVCPVLAAGTRIGVFEVEAFTGAGGMGQVYRARDTRLDRRVALKVLSADDASDPRRRARFVFEARAIARLSHPNICALHDLGHHEGLDFLVMEYLHGETLASRLRNGPFMVADAVHIAIQIAEALEAAHAEGIVHSDLKPANIMLVNGGAARDGRPDSKLLDFGLARFQVMPRISASADPATDRAGRSGRQIIGGTPQYMAPEQVRGEEADPRSDIFSFGCVLYEMVSGRAAFPVGAADDVMSAIVGVDSSPRHREAWRSDLESTSAARRLERVIGRCLEKAPEWRYPRIGDVRIELQEVRRTVAATHGRRSRRRVVVAATALVAAAVGLGLRERARSVSLPLPPMQVVQLTSLNGLARSPTFSPDGTQVAFSWNGEREDNYDIYVKTVGSSDVRRLTTDPAADTLPVWSADGHEIAFIRDHPESGNILHSVRPSGGGERKLSDFRVAGGESATIAWSPDSRWIVARPNLTEEVVKNGWWALYLIPVGTGAPRRLTNARGPDINLAPAFSPDGRRLAYSACGNLTRRVCAVNVIELTADYTPAGPPRRLATEGGWQRTVAWSRDGRSIVYDTIARGRWELWRVSLENGARPERLEVPGYHSRHPAIAPAGNRLAFARASEVRSVFRLRTKGDPEPVLVSSAPDYNPRFSPDGRRIVFSSRRSGDVEEIWLASADGSGLRQLTHGPGTRQTRPAWSPDGRQIAFASSTADALADIWTIPADGGVPRRVTTDAGEESGPVWSRDGKRIYFMSDRGGDAPHGGRDTWQVPAEGGASTRVTRGGSSLVAFESPDGKELIYQSMVAAESTPAKGPVILALGDSPLLAVPSDGGRTRQVVPCVKLLSFAVVSTDVYFSPCGSHRARDRSNGYIRTWPPGSDIPIHALDLSTGRVRVVGSVRSPFDADNFAVSPDGKTILVHRTTVSSDLMLVEHFR